MKNNIELTRTQILLMIAGAAAVASYIAYCYMSNPELLRHL